MVVDTEVGEFIGRVALTPRRREPYAEPYDILRIVTQEDAREEAENRELARGMRPFELCSFMLVRLLFYRSSFLILLSVV